MVERIAVNDDVVGSSPTSGATFLQLECDTYPQLNTVECLIK